MNGAMKAVAVAIFAHMVAAPLYYEAAASYGFMRNNCVDDSDALDADRLGGFIFACMAIVTQIMALWHLTIQFGGIVAGSIVMDVE